MKSKVIFENAQKKQFIFRAQDSEKPFRLSYYQDFDGYYLSMPKEAVEQINEAIGRVIDKKYKIETEQKNDNGETYENVSFGVKLYELRDKIGTQNAYLSDVVIKFSEFTFGKKVGLSKALVDCVVSAKQHTYLAGDDFFDDLRETDEPVEVVADDDQPDFLL